MSFYRAAYVVGLHETGRVTITAGDFGICSGCGRVADAQPGLRGRVLSNQLQGGWLRLTDPRDGTLHGACSDRCSLTVQRECVDSAGADVKAMLDGWARAYLKLRADQRAARVAT